MKPLWVQAAAGALVGAVVAGLAFVPGRLLGPANHVRPLALPATVPAPAVHMSLPKPKPVVRHTVRKQIVVAPVAQLAAVRPVTPVVVPTRVVHKPKPAVHVTARPKPKPLISPKVLAHPRQPKDALAPKPATTPAPAPTPAPTPASTSPAASTAPAATATISGSLSPTPTGQVEAAPATTTATSSSSADNGNRSQGHGHDHDHHGHGHGHNG